LCVDPAVSPLSYIGSSYFPTYSQQMYNTTVVNLEYTKNANNLDSIPYINLYVSGSDLVFNDERFLHLCGQLETDTCAAGGINCTDVNVTYTLEMPYPIKTTNANSMSGTSATWSFGLEELTEIDATCSATPPTTATTATTATTTTEQRTPSTAMIIVVAVLGAMTVLLRRKH